MRDKDFERMFAEHAQGLFGFLAYRTGDRVLAEDLLADAFERALRSRRRYDFRRGSQRTWLYSIALNCLRDHKRREAAEMRALDRIALAEGTATDLRRDEMENRAGDRDAVARALEALSDEERQAVALRFGADLTVPEIAELTGEPLSRTEGRVYRGLRKLRDHLPAE